MIESGVDEPDATLPRLILMKKTLIIALAIGSLISAVLLFLDWLTDYSTDLMNWQMLGISAAYLFWGAVNNSVLLGTVLAWAVNAFVYSVPALVVVAFFRSSKSSANRQATRSP